MSKVIMVQGTMSNAGKSLIVAGLCRIFKEDGYRVAPFKSQNMALNSYITKNGHEIGRAQAVQAMACGIEPTVAMNPILLKPTTDVGSQVIVNGKPIGNMPAKEYFAYKKQLIPEIMAAYEKLSMDYDIIVVEGAGSPAEINLKSDDIVNMGLAKMLDAPVLLVGDIDRGGVFAQLYGTVELLEEDEKERICGLIINKFRGDRSILEPGIRMIEDKCKKNVVGVIPYMNVDIEEEDSLSERFENTNVMDKNIGTIRVCVIKLPRMSNYTDFAPLEADLRINLWYASNYHDIESADWVIIPGSKNTIADLSWMRANGIEAAVKKAAAKGKLITGICGGYQMLGNTIIDEEGVESADGQNIIRGMELLDANTVFNQEKRTVQSKGTFCADGLLEELQGNEVSGYEIHMGRTTCAKGMELLQLDNGEMDGCIKDTVFGTYFHGILENAVVVEHILRYLCEKKGIMLENAKLSYEDYREQQFDHLAKEMRANLDMQEIYRILEMEKV